MTRFWISLDQGVDFVLSSHGDDARRRDLRAEDCLDDACTDLAAAVCPGLAQRTVGIRPGEKLHEMMIPATTRGMTAEFDLFFVIQPAVHLWGAGEYHDYGGERGRPVPPDFEYASNTNSQWLDTEQLRAVIG